MFLIFTFQNIKLIVAKTITKKESTSDNERSFCHKHQQQKILICNFASSKKLIINFYRLINNKFIINSHYCFFRSYLHFIL